MLSMPVSVKIIYEPESADAPYVAYSPEFDVSSCGPSEEIARRHLSETVQILFEEADRKGKTDELLEELGFRKQRRFWQVPRVSWQQVWVNLKSLGDFHAQDFSTSLS